jgi:hypothetical protein
MQRKRRGSPPPVRGTWPREGWDRTGAMCIKLGMLAVLTCFCTGHKSLQLPYKTYGKHHHTKHMGLGYFFMPWALESFVSRYVKIDRSLT